MLARLSAAALASLALVSASDAAVVYGGGNPSGSVYNPGSGDTITYMNCFATVGAGQSQLAIDSVAVGIYRFANALDVGINLYAAEMTFDGTTFGRGVNNLVYSTASIGAGGAAGTQTVSSGAVSGVTLNLETTSNAGFGGWWIGVQFTGANAASATNGWRTATAPTTGASINGFGVFNFQGSGAFQAFFAFGNPPGSLNSRLLTTVEGNLVPAPGALALLGVAGLAGGARRRR